MRFKQKQEHWFEAPTSHDLRCRICLSLQTLAALRTAHASGDSKMGVDVEGDSITDQSAAGVLDLMSTKESALRLAVDAAVTVLRVRWSLECLEVPSEASTFSAWSVQV